MARVQINPQQLKAGDLTFLPSGSSLLDLVLGGGWAIGRMANLVGDKSAGKTLLAIEACANFAQKFDVENIRYAEAEAAFDVDYARSMGLPEGVQPTETGEITTVEEFYKDLKQFLDERDGKRPSMYILDSLDSLSDDAEVERKFGDATYGTGKAKMMSELFRRLTADIRDKKCLLLIISQIRDKIGVTFGETKTRSGGRALDFYASQIVWLSEIKKLTRQVSGVPRVTGVQVMAKNKKNKVGKPFRDAEFSILFNYGVDDETSMLDWLHKYKGGHDLPMSLEDARKQLASLRTERDRDGVRTLRNQLLRSVDAHWERVEAALAPTISKY